MCGCPVNPEGEDRPAAPHLDSGQSDPVAGEGDAGHVNGSDGGAVGRSDGGSDLAHDGGPPIDPVGDGGIDDHQDAGVSGTTGLFQRPSNPTCLAHDRPNLGADVELQPAFAALTFQQPVAMEKAPGDSDYWYVVERRGRVLRFLDDDNVTTTDVFIDIDSRVNSNDSETGLLGLAFHPAYQQNGEVFLSYTETGVGGDPYRSVISRFKTTNGGQTLDPDTEEIILTQTQPYKNHNGGDIKFGPDGYLYISFGDGGSAGDPLNAGQDVSNLMGAILRIDVDTGDPYTVPWDNPFVGTSGRDEIYAWGLRNVWKFSFDTDSGEMWAGDVGQGAREEIDIIERGGNYGWKIREGTACYGVNPCDQGGLIDPILDYPHAEGKSITGGYVYRGGLIPGLVGAYIYGDYKFGKVWALLYDPQTGEPSTELLASPGFNLSSFAQDEEGEVYVLRYSLSQGRIYRLIPVGSSEDDTFPQRLTQTGCFSPSNPQVPLDALIPYSINWPFWSDGALKRRYFAVPDTETITLGVDGRLNFPVGSVLVKEFYTQERRLETRLFMRHSDGDWGGYTYVWNDAQTEAHLLSGGGTIDLGTQTWMLPSRPQCLVCHSEVVGRALGLRTQQLNKEHFYESTQVTANQLDTYQSIGLMNSVDANLGDVFPSLDGDATVSEKSRTYLDVNCASCHQPEGLGQGDLDLRYSTELADMNLCDVEPQEGNLGVSDAMLIWPGDPTRSVLFLRMQSTDVNRMPDTGSLMVDEVGTELVEEWISSLAECP